MTREKIGLGDIAFAGAVGTVALTLWAVVLDFSKGDLAAWVQAIGSIAAVGVAIWLMSEQHRRDQVSRARDEKLKEARLLKSIRIEVEVLFAAFCRTTNNVFATTPKGNVFDTYYRVPPNPFAVFDSHVGQIGVVEDDDIRRLIIVTYTRFNGLLTVIAMNNDVIDEIAAEAKANDGTLDPPRAEELRRRLVHLGDQAIDRYNEAADCAAQIDSRLARF